MSHNYRVPSWLICPVGHGNSLAATVKAKINCPLCNIPGQRGEEPIDETRPYDVWTYIGRLPVPGGKVFSRFAADRLAVTNVTTPLHIFRGAVRRSYRQDGPGDWYVDTRGRGRSLLPGADRLNQLLGRKIFAEVNRRCAAHVQA